MFFVTTASHTSTNLPSFWGFHTFDSSGGLISIRSNEVYKISVVHLDIQTKWTEGFFLRCIKRENVTLCILRKKERSAIYAYQNGQTIRWYNCFGSHLIVYAIVYTASQPVKMEEGTKTFKVHTQGLLFFLC